MKNMWVYIMASPSKTLYIGVTNNLERRMWEHRHGQGSAFAAKHGCTKLVHCEDYVTPFDAIAREKELKGWVRRRKIALIEETNPEWRDLSVSWTNDVAAAT